MGWDIYFDDVFFLGMGRQHKIEEEEESSPLNNGILSQKITEKNVKNLRNSGKVELHLFFQGNVERRETINHPRRKIEYFTLLYFFFLLISFVFKTFQF